MENFITVSQAAAMLHRHRWTIWNWVRLGKLKPVAYAGREALFDRGYIEEKAKNLAREKRSASS